MTAGTSYSTGTPGTAQPVLQLRGITKQYGELFANKDVNFELLPGEIHCLCGENGAGKSTLMNILYGLVSPTSGEFLMEGKPVQITGPRHAIDLGIGMVHQHFMLIPVFTVAENIVLADEPMNGVQLDIHKGEQDVRELSERYSLQVDPTALVQDITVGQQQRAEILKALFRRAKILILDEPTAVLTPQEIEELLAIVRQLRDEGMSIIFITHKLKEVLAIADRISVLRRGTLIDTVPNVGLTEESIARLMVGRDVLLRVDKTPAEPGRPVLSLHDIWAKDSRGLDAVKGVSFDVHAGEIVALAGIDGNGQSQLIEVIAGLHHAERGTVIIDGEDVTGATPREVGHAGLAHIPQDRHKHGLILEYTLEENLILHDHDSAAMSRMGIIDHGAMHERAERLLAQFDVRGGGPEQVAGGLSGGNQQKVVIAREIERDPKIMIAAQPTRGVDVGAIEFIHQQLIAERDAGKAVLLVSLEMDEVLSLADRIVVIFEGEIVGEYLSGEVDENGLGLAMTGSTVPSSPGGMSRGGH